MRVKRRITQFLPLAVTLMDLRAPTIVDGNPLSFMR
jgi:hypothetical protein